ncbi:MAG: hypothetical protein Q8O67_06210 [Deltaproteobacteria bacterium]|nr:hypothetical protein [Deltaproteobacteria bacterium]
MPIAFKTGRRCKSLEQGRTEGAEYDVATTTFYDLTASVRELVKPRERNARTILRQLYATHSGGLAAAFTERFACKVSVMVGALCLVALLASDVRSVSGGFEFGGGVGVSPNSTNVYLVPVAAGLVDVTLDGHLRCQDGQREESRSA